MKRIGDILVRPLMTEKSAAMMDQSNTYAFEVGRDASKIEIGHAVTDLFGVRVKQVRTMVVRGKVKRFGRYYGKRSNWKKAFVTLHEDDALNIYTGV
jgi:large subunit ribosomal protein L23